MLAAGELQRVSASLESAAAFLDAAELHLASALKISSDDLDGSYGLIYDAARKSLAAVLQAQGLRAKAKGGHYAIQQAIEAQFTAPPPRDVFRSFGRMRRTRNQVEYDEISLIGYDDIRADHAQATAIHAMAVLLQPNLPVFSD
jgi:hypothetical protein